MEEFVPHFEESQQRSNGHDAPIPIDENAQLQSSDSEPPQITDLLHLTHAKKTNSKVLRDEEPPAIYSQQRPTGVRKRTQREPPRNTIPRRHQLGRGPEIEDRLYELPPSLLALNSEQGKLQPLLMMQSQPGIYRNFGGTGYATGEQQADQRRHELAPQPQASYPRSMPYAFPPQPLHGTYRSFEATPPPGNNMLHYAQPQQQIQGTYRTFEAKHPVNNVGTDHTPELRHDDFLANKSQSIRDQFGARLPPPYEPSTSSSVSPFPFEHYYDSFPDSNQRQPGFGGGGVPQSSIPPYESPFILTPQAESSFASTSKEDDVLENFDFDAFLKEEDAKGTESFDFQALTRSEEEEKPKPS